MGEITFTWAINDFDMCPHVSGKSLVSPAFSIDGFKNATFRLILYPRGNKEEHQNYVALFLRGQNNEENEMYIEYELCLVDASGKGDRILKSRRLFQNNISMGCHKFYERHLLQNYVARHFLPQNTLTVRCRISVLDKKDSSYEKMYGIEDHEGLTSDFGELLQSGAHSDLTIAVGGREFKVHRTILDNRCPEMVKQLVKMEDSTAYTLSSVEAPVLQHILSYVYTGVYCDDGLLEKVFIAANTFSLKDLTSSLFPYPACILSTTQINAFQSTFTWVIEDFGSLQLTKGNAFLLLSDDMARWVWMKICLLKVKNDDGHSYVLSFQRMFGDEATFLRCEISAPDTGDKLRVCEHGFESELKWTVDFEANSLEEMAQSGELRLQLKIRVSASGHDTTETEEVKYNSISPKKSIRIESSNYQKDLQKFYENMRNADLILCLDGGKLPAHRAILSARSEVFSKMFFHDLEEKKTDVVKIVDVDVPTMASVLMYMYCGVLDGPMTVQKAIDIYAASDKYNLLVLKEKCCGYLKFNVNAENAGDVLVLADERQDESLKKCVFHFISSNPERILNSERGLKVLEDRGLTTLYAEIVNLLLSDGLKERVFINEIVN